MTVRLLTISDYDDIYSLWLSCSGMGLNDIDDSRQGVERFLKRNPETCFVSVENDADGESIITGVIMAGNQGRQGTPAAGDISITPQSVPNTGIGESLRSL